MHPAGDPAITTPNLTISNPARTSTGGGGGRSTMATYASSSSA